MIKKLIFLFFVPIILFAQTDRSIKWWDNTNKQFKVTSIPYLLTDSLTANPSAPGSGRAVIYTGLGRKMWVRWGDGTVTEITGSGGSFANQSLSNLTSPTSVNQHLLPSVNLSYDLGSSSARWRDIFTRRVIIDTLEAVNTLMLKGNIYPVTGGGLGYSTNLFRTLYIWGNDADDYSGEGIFFRARNENAYVNLKLADINYSSINEIHLPNASGTIPLLGYSEVLNTNYQKLHFDVTDNVFKARVVEYMATYNATLDYVDVSIPGLTSNSIVYAVWGKNVTNPPLGSLYVVSTGTNTCRIASNADELYNHNIIVVVARW